MRPTDAKRMLRKKRIKENTPRAAVHELSVEYLCSSDRAEYLSSYFDQRMIAVLRKQNRIDGMREKCAYTIVLPDTVTSVALVCDLSETHGILAVRIREDVEIMMRRVLEI